MNNLDDLKEQIKNQFLQISNQIQESEAYSKLSDRYQSLNSTGQKTVQIASVFLILALVFYSPVSQLSLSQDLIVQFESHRNLIRELFKTYRETSNGSVVAQPPQTSELVSSIQNVLQNARLIPEQILSVNSINGVLNGSESSLIPKNLVSDIIEVKLGKLNLRQIIDIGTQFINLSYAVKLKDMSIKARSDLAGYFDVNYKLYTLKVPEALPEPAPEPVSTRNKKKKKQSEDESESEE